MALDLVFDRTAADAERWNYLATKMDSHGWGALTSKEQAEWLTKLKGGYNHTDMNRVGTAVALLGVRFANLILYLVEYREMYGVANMPLFNVPYTSEDITIAPKTNWAEGDPVWADQATQYLANLSVLRELLPPPANTPRVPADLVNLTLDEANDIERLLYMVEEEITRVTLMMEKWIRDTAATWHYSGDLYSKEV